MESTNVFLQGVRTVTGAGLDFPAPADPPLTHVVAGGSVCQALYFRGGNSTDELVLAVLTRDGEPMRYFPIGAKADTHVALRVVEDVMGDSVLELLLAAPAGVSGDVVVDLGLVEY
ncbi:MAG: hypothetical protein L0G22_09185 [Propionibacteriaceae bacterium]|nr:hypothetical protein [Propionibacteriaceae bacterium]